MKNRYFYMRPILLCAIGLCAGITIGRFFHGPFVFLVAPVLLFLSFLLLLCRKYRLFTFLFFVAAGLLRILLAYPTLPAPADNCLLTGTVCELPASSVSGYTLTLNNAARNGQQIDGRVILFIKAENHASPFEYGEKIAAQASIELPLGARNEGGMDMRFYYLSKHIVCIARAKEDALRSVGRSMDFYGRLLALKEKTTSILTDLIGPAYGPVAAAMLHGETKEIPEETLVRFRESGIAHLLAVSGLHVSLLCAVLLFFIKRFQPLMQLVLLFLFLLFYCMFTAFSPSTVRASIMILCLLTGNALERRNDALCALSFSCILVLGVAPFELFTAGLQLSFSAVLGILFLADPVSRLFEKRVPKSISGLLGASIGAQLGTLGPSAVFFNRIAVFSLFSNLLVVPLSVLVILPALLALLSYPFSAAFAQVFASISGVTLRLMDAVAAFTASAGSLSFSSPTPAVCIALFLTFAFLSDYFLGARKHRSTLVSLLLMLSLLLYNAPDFFAPRNSITVLALRKGIALHIHSGNKDAIYGSYQGIQSIETKGYLQHHNLPESESIIINTEELSFMLHKEKITIGEGYLRIGERIYYTETNGQTSVHIQNEIPVVQAYAVE